VLHAHGLFPRGRPVASPGLSVDQNALAWSGSASPGEHAPGRRPLQCYLGRQIDDLHERATLPAPFGCPAARCTQCNPPHIDLDQPAGSFPWHEIPDQKRMMTCVMRDHGSVLAQQSQHVMNRHLRSGLFMHSPGAGAVPGMSFPRNELPCSCCSRQRRPERTGCPARTPRPWAGWKRTPGFAT